MKGHFEFCAPAQEFKFLLDQLVNIRISEEWGQVKARSQHANGENQYFIHYQAADKCAKSEWFGESTLSAVEDDRSPGMPVFAALKLPEGETVEE
ncbi:MULTISPECIES: hypothetical protein [unclassified Raoultella]|uniref:hypothetical protein n=1 Tax=unclassified Raoultella TaxID=2627600 RepID=UPI00135A2C9B|nr:MULTISPECIES: hypothetical protein [unclassified Raoultella]